MKTNLKDKLHELQKKYPQEKLRALVIKDSDLNFAFTFRRAIGVTTIESNRYNGILYQRITQDRTDFGNPNSLKVELIVNSKYFDVSTVRSLALVNKYEI